MGKTPGWGAGAPQPLTGEEVLYLHYRLVERAGRRHGVRDVGLLKEALARPSRTLQGRPVFATPFERAAVLMHALATGDAFEDGNLETALAVGVLALRREGVDLEARPAELAGMMRRVAAGAMSFQDLAGWLERCGREAGGGGGGKGDGAWRTTGGSGRRSGRAGG